MLTVIHIPTGDVMGQFETTQAARHWIKMGDVEDWGDFRAVDENGDTVQLPFMHTPRP
jgi:hypothetical protein